MNETFAAGYLYLVQRFGLSVCGLFAQSFMTTRSTKETIVKGDAKQTFFPLQRYVFEDSWQAQVSFALKYEGVNIEVLRALFGKLDKNEIMAFVMSHPLGIAQKKLWFLYEFLTEDKLDLPDGEGGYIPLVDKDIQFCLSTSVAVRDRRSHVINNLIGNRLFSPYIRKTELLAGRNFLRLKDEANRLLAQYSPDLVYRAVQYLYIKETKSSFAIERERPDQRRMDAFVSLLRSMSDTPLAKAALVAAQNSVVDERYRQSDWRGDQVYVGETIAPGNEKIHFIAPRPDAISELMDGFLDCLTTWLRTPDADPVMIAAVMGFAFVFLHPFDDGNGRVHRFLIHAILAQLDFVPHGLIFPVSAVMLREQLAYDKALETFSLRVMPLLDYEVNDQGEVAVGNDSRDLYRAIDYTPIVEYFFEVIAKTIRTEWRAELDYLKRYDRIRASMRKIVDLPEKKANQFILFAEQNGGKLSQRKRANFSELTDEEMAQLERCLEVEVEVEGEGQRVEVKGQRSEVEVEGEGQRE